MATLIRILLAVALVLATGVNGVRAQLAPCTAAPCPQQPPVTPTTTPTTTTPPPVSRPTDTPLHLPSDSNRVEPLLIVSSIVIGVVGLLVARYAFSHPPTLPFRTPASSDPLISSLPGTPLPTRLGTGPGRVTTGTPGGPTTTTSGGSGPGGRVTGGGSPGGGTPGGGTPGGGIPPGGGTPGGPPGVGPGGPPGGGPVTAALRAGFNVPATGAPHVPNEVMLDIPATVPAATLDEIAARHSMTRLETVTLRLTGRTLHRWRIDGGGSVADMIRTLSASERRHVAGAQAIFIFRLAEAAAPAMNAEQYAPQKLNLPAAHRLATGNGVAIAVIDSEVDVAHPDLTGAVTANYKATTDAERERPHAHGTGMAGAIAARRTMLGTAPRVALLTINAFSTRAAEAEGTTFNILKGLDWAAGQGARIINMSFAGPSDPRLRDALSKAYRKNIVLIAAAGNAGPNSPPLFPAADPNVIAVTATDADDALFSGANRGNHIAVAAPGVDILVPAPDGAYQFTTGTSVAAAEVSGVVALLLERNPSLTPAEVRRILTASAKDLGPRGRDASFGAGLVDALKALTSAGSGRPGL